MFDIRVFNALATQTSIKIDQISFNVTTPFLPNWHLEAVAYALQLLDVRNGSISSLTARRSLPVYPISRQFQNRSVPSHFVSNPDSKRARRRP